MTMLLLIVLSASSVALAEVSKRAINYRHEARKWRQRAMMYSRELDDLNHVYGGDGTEDGQMDTLYEALKILHRNE